MKNINSLSNKLRRIASKPPSYIAKRLWHELLTHSEKYRAPKRSKRFTKSVLLKLNQSTSINELWNKLANQTFICNRSPELDFLQKNCPSNFEYLTQKANDASAHIVNLLGTGPTHLGQPIEWNKDYKINKIWENAFYKNIEYTNLDLPSDVKIPWEISRMQWLIPAAQIYLLKKDDAIAKHVKDILQDWIKQNSYAWSVNWTCTMEVAIRIIVWIYLFYVFHDAKAWQDEKFQEQFLISLYLHGDFTRRNLEESDINGNHYIADAAGLVFAGLFFRKSSDAKKWHQLGWNILSKEIIFQVTEDGVDHEGSVPYHRLVTEIFFFPAYYRLVSGFDVDKTYQQRLIAMADYIAHYSRADGTAPLIGDADDARILPFGEQAINDHRYLIGLIAVVFNHDLLMNYFSGSVSEIFWCLNNAAVGKLKAAAKTKTTSKPYQKAGYFILRNDTDHVFVDCAPVGLGNRGGHGHNDCLSFEATLLNVPLIVDSGAYVYTASPKARNQFRSTSSHNTPMIDDIEINPFISPLMLWNLNYQAKPQLIHWEQNEKHTIFCGAHSGYKNLVSPVEITRTIRLDHENHILLIKDTFKSTGKHSIQIPFHLHPEVQIEKHDLNKFLILENDKKFIFDFELLSKWNCRIEESEYSPSYGIKLPNQRLVCAGTLDNGEITVTFTIRPL